MKILNVLFCLFSFCFIDVNCAPNFVASTSDSFLQSWDETVSKTKSTAILSKISAIDNDKLLVLPFNAGQGNVILATIGTSVSIIDAGSISTDFQNIDNVLISNIFTNRKLTSVIVTHDDKDHYSFLNNIFRIASEKGAISDEIVFVTRFGSKSEDCIRNIINDYKIKKFSLYVHKYDGERIKFINRPWATGRIPNGTTVDVVEKNIAETISSHEDFKFNFLLPTFPIQDAGNNSHSLVFRISYKGQSILFTGDATGKTLDAIWGNANNEIAKQNRLLLQGINFVIGPHHCADSERSPVILNRVIKSSWNNFTGVLFCVPNPQEALFHHPRNYIDHIVFPESAVSDKHPIHFFTEQNGDFVLKEKNTSSNIFFTSDIADAFCIELSNDGMFLYYSDKTQKLVSEFGFSVYLQDQFDKLNHPINLKKFLSTINFFSNNIDSIFSINGNNHNYFDVLMCTNNIDAMDNFLFLIILLSNETTENKDCICKKYCDSFYQQAFGNYPFGYQDGIRCMLYHAFEANYKDKIDLSDFITYYRTQLEGITQIFQDFHHSLNFIMTNFTIHM